MTEETLLTCHDAKRHTIQMHMTINVMFFRVKQTDAYCVHVANNNNKIQFMVNPHNTCKSNEGK